MASCDTDELISLLLSDPDADVSTVGGLLADLTEGELVDLAAATARWGARLDWLHGRACAQAMQAAPTSGEHDTRMGTRYIRSAMATDLAIACRISQASMWKRVQRAEDLTANLPATEARYAAGDLDRVMVDITRRESADLTAAGRHRLDEVIAGRPDPLTEDPESGRIPLRPLRRLPASATANPTRWGAALRRRAAYLDRRRADAAHTEAKAAWTGVWTHAEPDGLATMVITGTATDIWTVKTALDAVAEQGADQLEALVSWATHALAGLAPGTGGGPFPRPHLVVTVPLATLTGEDEAPAHLTGYGPLPSDLLDEVKQRATWRCAVVDADGTLVALSHTTHTPCYTPPDRLRSFITLAWDHCAFPACTSPAQACDLDHTSPYPAGRTCECNLRPLCRHHHNLKTHTRWSCRLASGPDHPPGTLEWTSPTGRILHSEPGLPDLLNWWTPHGEPNPPNPTRNQSQHHDQNPRTHPSDRGPLRVDERRATSSP